MTLSYDAFVSGFLSKVCEYDLLQMDDEDLEDVRETVVYGYLKRAVVSFKKNCKYDLVSAENDEAKCFDIEIDEDDVDELVDIISEGMLVQWMKPYVYKQENLENLLNTADYTTYSPAELIHRVGNAYAKVQSDYTQMIREYSYNHNDLTELHI